MSASLVPTNTALVASDLLAGGALWRWVYHGLNRIRDSSIGAQIQRVRGAVRELHLLLSGKAMARKLIREAVPRPQAQKASVAVAFVHYFFSYTDCGFDSGIFESLVKAVLPTLKRVAASQTVSLPR